MSGLKYLDALASERAHNRTLRLAVLVIAGLGAVGMFYTWQIPKNIDVHLAPDMRAGDTVRVVAGEAPVPPANVYGFAYYIWQQINRWQADGSKDYGQQIFSFQSYLTPSCQAQLTADMENRSKGGELRMRTRQVSEIPGFSYSSNRVISEGTARWTVLLDMQVIETYRGQAVKDTFIRYPLRVTRFNVDRERNPWQLALDCYGTHRPARLDEKDLRAALSNGQQATVPTLPTSIEPSALPSPVPISAPVASTPSAKPQRATPTTSAQPQP